MDLDSIHEKRAYLRYLSKLHIVDCYLDDNAPMSEAGLQAFESTYQIILPDQYRTYLQEIGSVKVLNEAIELTELNTDEPVHEVLKRPFPLTESWSEFDSPTLTYDKVHVGILPVGMTSCSDQIYLVITGEDRGRLWFGNGSFLEPMGQSYHESIMANLDQQLETIKTTILHKHSMDVRAFLEAAENLYTFITSLPATIPTPKVDTINKILSMRTYWAENCIQHVKSAISGKPVKFTKIHINQYSDVPIRKLLKQYQSSSKRLFKLASKIDPLTTVLKLSEDDEARPLRLLLRFETANINGDIRNLKKP